MSRLGGAFWFILVIATGMTNFLVKQTVQNLDDQLTQVKHKTADDQKKIHDLRADWTYLNQPALLSELNNRYIHLAPMSPKQVVGNLDSIPMRPAPPPEETPPPIAEVSAAAPAPTPAIAVAMATPAPAPVPVAAPAPAAARSPVVAVSAPSALRPPAPSLSLISVAHAATVTPAAPPPVRPRPAPASAPAPQQPASLDALFAQVVGNR